MILTPLGAAAATGHGLGIPMGHHMGHPMGRPMGISMPRLMGRPMGIPMGRPMGRPTGRLLGRLLGRPMGRPMATSLSQVSPQKAKATQKGASSDDVATAHGLHVSNVFSRILSYSHVPRILDHRSWIQDPGTLAWTPEPGPGPGPAQRTRHTCVGLEV